MMDKIQTINRFWGSFELPAYDENSVPDKTPLPYITYDVSDSDFGNSVALNASLWYRSSSWSAITAKAEEIAEFITRGGRMVNYDDGAIWIQKGTPWAQRMGDPDDMIRRIVLSVVVEFLE